MAFFKPFPEDNLRLRAAMLLLVLLGYLVLSVEYTPTLSNSFNVDNFANFNTPYLDLCVWLLTNIVFLPICLACLFALIMSSFDTFRSTTKRKQDYKNCVLKPNSYKAK